MVPKIRITCPNAKSIRKDRDFVLYWCVAYRRPTWNFALQRAVELATALEKPLVVLEPLRIGYPWASDRLHSFVIEGMADSKRHFATSPAFYWPYIEPEAGAGKGLLEALGQRACAIVTDEFPCFFIPRMQAAAAARAEAPFEVVDSVGLLPLRAADQVFATAFSLRRFLQKTLPPHLEQMPLPNPLSNVKLPRLEKLPNAIARRWPAATDEVLSQPRLAASRLPIDHSVAPAIMKGGVNQAKATLENFLDHKLSRYGEERNQPEEDVASGLSPYLHFGHISAHQALVELARVEDWSPGKLGAPVGGRREGWWRMSPSAESFLDELVTWRELGFNFCLRRPDFDQFASLPDWAKATLTKHASDPRPHRYALGQFEASETHDPLWNAAQRQLVREGRIHNYLRMLWGKKILEWSESPDAALETMIHLNNKYAVDGRDPNSYSGIFWTLGRYDRPWAPERPIFGTIRYMSSDNTARKLRVRQYLDRYGK